MPTFGIYTAGGDVNTTAMGPTGANINAEDVLDLIVDVTPWETPVVTMLPKTVAMSTRHEWIEDGLEPISSRHDRAEGSDFEAESVPTQIKRRVPNFLQHFRYGVKVSNLQRMMNPYGINDQYAYEVGKTAKQLGKDLETRILEDTVIISAATFYGREEATGAPARMRPLAELIARQAGQNDLNADTLTNITDTAHTAVVTTAATPGVWNGATPAFAAQATLTESVFNRTLQLIHGSVDAGGGHPDTAIVFPAAYNVVGTYGKAEGTIYSAATLNIEAAIKKIIRAVKFYDSQFGMIEVINSRWCPRATNLTGTAFVRGATPQDATRNNGFVYFIERNKVRLAFGRTFRHVPLPPVGDSTRGMVLGDVTLELLGWKTAWLVAGVNSVL